MRTPPSEAVNIMVSFLCDLVVMKKFGMIGKDEFKSESVEAKSTIREMSAVYPLPSQEVVHEIVRGYTFPLYRRTFSFDDKIRHKVSGGVYTLFERLYKDEVGIRN
ncbi:MAG: hypothetical protein QF632_04230 [Candidatus Woesearchaeota archaeon]|jgi:hypothetical protein|nr:hypothetical protein [Candidatus Woesearchaeota archaeon]MDP7457319.1 hypothetical protein [Candidatus Woesearchaeota archaeon]|tara:strand:- start:465 stop:782 length:318 start_codon:yes stop_codon:yes gene_type:complete